VTGDDGGRLAEPHSSLSWRPGIRNFIVGVIMECSSDETRMRKEKVYLNKLNLVLVQVRHRLLPLTRALPLRSVAEQDDLRTAPHRFSSRIGLHRGLSSFRRCALASLTRRFEANWRCRTCSLTSICRLPALFPQIVASSKTSLSLCENNMVILKLLSEEIFDYSAEQMTQAKTRHLKDQMCGEFSEIFSLCLEVLEKAQKPSLIKSTLETLLRFLNWIPLGFIFETNIIDSLVQRVSLGVPQHERQQLI
jgi:hypothetical protein